MAWSKRRYSPRLFVAGAGLMLLFSIARSANNWPTVVAALPTEAPLQLQMIGIVGVGLVGLAISAVLVGLALGAVPHRLTRSADLPGRDATQLGIAAGLIGAAAAALAGSLRSPGWAHVPNVAGAGSFFPLLQAALDPTTRVLMITAVLLPTLLTVDRWTGGWTRRRVPAALLLALVGFAVVGVPAGVQTSGWLLGGLIVAGALILSFAAVLRFDLSMVPLAAGTMTAVGAIARGAERAYPGALAGAAGGAILAFALGWWWFTAFRRARIGAAASVAELT
jgi:hypothetical protein